MFAPDGVSPAWLAALRGAAAAPDLWAHGLAIVERAADVVVGTVGFKGPPDQHGVVEIAYRLQPSVAGASPPRRRGPPSTTSRAAAR